jgi:hypothetical protein
MTDQELIILEIESYIAGHRKDIEREEQSLAESENEVKQHRDKLIWLVQDHTTVVMEERKQEWFNTTFDIQAEALAFDLQMAAWARRNIQRYQDWIAEWEAKLEQVRAGDYADYLFLAERAQRRLEREGKR